MELNTKMRYALTCALYRNEYNKICRLQNEKDDGAHKPRAREGG